MLRHRVLTQAMLWIIRGLVKDYPRPCARSVAVRAHARALRAHWQTKCARIILGDYQKLPGIIPLCARSARCARRVYHVVAYQCAAMNNDYHILPETIKQKLMQLTDTEFATWINRAAPTAFYHGARMYAGNPDAPRRNLVQHAIWGQFKSDEQLDHLTSSILEAFPPSAATPACLISTLSTTHDLGQEFETDEAANLRQWSRRGAPSINQSINLYTHPYQG